MRLVVLVGTLAACGTGTNDRAGKPALAPSVESGPGGAPRTPAPRERASFQRLHMTERFADLLQMERALVAGELDVVREYATALALDRTDADLAAWSAELAQMREAALALSEARDVATAGRRARVLAVACARCHLVAGAQLPISDAGPPPDDGTTSMRMARHQWAADRLWVALVAPSGTAWRDGVAVLADPPLPFDELAPHVSPDARTRMAELSLRLRALADAEQSVDDLDRWAATYGDALEICAACHALAR